MRQKQEKTNAMRLLERAGIGYEVQSYPHDGEAVDGIEVARLLGQDPASVFKTLVARGAGRNYYVFDIPVAQELDLKKAARAVGEKAVTLVHVKELFPLTGYVRGGCSPVGMKKRFPTVLDASAAQWPRIAVSGGRIGCQLLLAPEDLLRATAGHYADLTR